MYVAPRPTAADDPLFPVRIAACCAAMFALVEFLSTDLPGLTVALPLAFALGLRGAFNPGKLIGLGVATPILAWCLGWLFAVTREIPLLMALTSFALLIVGIHRARQKGDNLGFIVAMIVVLLSTMALQPRAVLDMMRDELMLDCVAGALVITLLYALIPPRTKLVHQDAPQIASENLLAGSVLRAFVVTCYCFWLYAVLPASDMIMALTALFPLVYPGRRSMLDEARARLLGTVLGLLIVVAVLAVFVTTPYFTVMLLALSLAGLGCGWGVMHGRLSPVAYQFALTTLLATTMTALTTQAALQAIISRFGLTLAGAAGSVLVVIFVEEMFPRVFKAGARAPRAVSAG